MSAPSNISILLGTAAVASPLGDFPLKLFLQLTDFSSATDPYDCYKQFIANSIKIGWGTACGMFNPTNMDPINTSVINGIVIVIAVILIGWGVADNLPKSSLLAEK
jgi:hypothetical protein